LNELISSSVLMNVINSWSCFMQSIAHSKT